MAKLEKTFIILSAMCLLLIIFAETVTPKYTFFEYPNVLSSSTSAFAKLLDDKVDKNKEFEDLKSHLAVISGSVSFYAINLGTGEEYKGDGKIYSKHYWGSTFGLYGDL